MSQPTQAGIIVKDYLKRFKNTKSKTLANKIFEENPLMFESAESARGLIRYYRKANGEKQRQRVTTDEFEGDGKQPPMPRSICGDYVPYIMPKANNKILGLFDIHLPFHSEEALSIALDSGKDRGCNTVLLGGDIVDFYSLSYFCKKPNLTTFRQEREMFWQLLDLIDHKMPGAKVIYLEGNHEYRYETYLMTKAPEIYDTEEFRLDILFKSAEKGFEYVAGKRVIEIGKLRAIHGHEYGNGVNTPVNAARNLFLKSKSCTIEGHFHATSEHTETNIDGDVITCWSVGCLAGLHPEYRPLNKWNNGFCLIDTWGNGQFNIDNLRIVKGKVV